MAVVLLLGLLLSGVSVALDRFVPGQQIDSEARQILARLDLARSSAIAAGRPYRVVLDLDKHEYRVFTPYNEDGRIAASKDEQQNLGREVLPAALTFAGLLEAGSDVPRDEGKVELVFPANGVMLDIFIYLASDAGEVYDKTLYMGGLTGKTRVIDGRVLPTSVSDADF